MGGCCLYLLVYRTVGRIYKITITEEKFFKVKISLHAGNMSMMSTGAHTQLPSASGQVLYTNRHTAKKSHNNNKIKAETQVAICADWEQLSIVLHKYIIV